MPGHGESGLPHGHEFFRRDHAVTEQLVAKGFRRGGFTLGRIELSTPAAADAGSGLSARL